MAGSMRGRAIGGVISALVTLGAAQAAPGSYPAMAPREQYLIADRSEEVALARSAAPPSISDDAEVMVLGPHGFETAVRGTNGFVCLVERAWDKPFDDAEFWNPRMRGPICLNAAAARTVAPTFLERARWALAGLSLSEMRDRSTTSAAASLTPARGAMSYMLSKQQYLSDTDGRWRPHVMLFTPATDPAAWGANLAGSPVLGAPSTPRVTFFFIPVRRWSDGTPDDRGLSPMPAEPHHH